MKRFATLGFIAVLAGCGADGAPEAPASMSSSTAGVTISGCASAGIVIGAPATGGPANC